MDLTTNRYNSGVASRGTFCSADPAQVHPGPGHRRWRAAEPIGTRVAVLIGKPASVFSIAPAPLAATVPAIPLGMPSELLERRPDVAGAERRVAARTPRSARPKPRISEYLAERRGGYESGILSKLFTMPSQIWSLEHRPPGQSSTRDFAARRSIRQRPPMRRPLRHIAKRS